MRTALRVLLAGTSLSAIAPASALAQADAAQPCPMSPSQAEVETVRHRMAIGLYDAVNRRGMPDMLIPMTIHIIRRSDGTGGLTQARSELAVEVANSLWVGSGIQFCTPSDIVYHDDDDLYNNTDTMAEVDALRQLGQVPDTINVYFVNNLRNELGSLCGISSFTTSDVQGVAISTSCLPHAGNPSTFAHELGHYFDLYHTHEFAFGDECTDGTNCDIAGDLVCDTPADPNVRGEVSPSDCVWNGAAAPDCGEAPFDPPVRNVLCYATSTCRDEFTPEQFVRAYSALVNFRPELIANSCDPCPNIADVNDDDMLSATDFSAWVDAYNAQSPLADQNGDGLITPTDFSAWVSNFNAGCR